MSKGERGRIPNAIKEMVAHDIKRYGFRIAFHYFACGIAWGSELSKSENQVIRAYRLIARSKE